MQERSTATVETILEAAAQVLSQSGLGRFNTERVAKRAGVSIGTLYQYFPNKQTLVYSLLERALNARDNALEAACLAFENSPVEDLIQGVVQTYIDSKFKRAALAVALLSAAAELGASAIMKQTSERCVQILSRAFAVSTDHSQAATEFPAVMIFNSMAETTRAVLRRGASEEQIAELRKHLPLLCCAYMRRWLDENRLMTSACR